MNYWGYLNPLHTSPRFVRRFALLFTACAALLGGALAYKAANNEITGTATYHTGWKRDKGEFVTKEGSREKFRHATNNIWAMSGFSFFAGTVALVFYRKLDDCLADPF